MNLRHHAICIGTIAVNTFKEAIRDRILHGIILLAVALVFLSIAFGQLSVENDARVIRDLGTTFTSLIVVIVAISSGISLLHKEIHRQTIYTIVTKPVARWSFIVGKYLGLVLTLVAVETLIGIVLVVIILLRGDPLHIVLLQALVLSLVEGALVAAVATLFSSFSTPFLSGLFTFGVFVVGRLREQIYEYADAIKFGALPEVIRVVGVIVPDLSLHRADMQVAYLISLNWSYVAYTVAYTGAYAAVLIVLAGMIFSRRDFV